MPENNTIPRRGTFLQKANAERIGLMANPPSMKTMNAPSEIMIKSKTL